MHRILLTALTLALWIQTASAASFKIGYIEAVISDEIISFNIQNVTGQNSINLNDAEFPVITPLSISGSLSMTCTLTCNSGASALSYDFSDIAPDDSGNNQTPFDPTNPFEFSLFTFSGNFSPNTNFMANNIIYTPLDNLVRLDSFSDQGEVKFWFLTVEGTVSEEVIPEPTTSGMLVMALVTLAAMRKNASTK